MAYTQHHLRGPKFWRRLSHWRGLSPWRRLSLWLSVSPWSVATTGNTTPVHRITLIGYRASGKSTIGRLLAARLAWPFIDADAVVEQQLKTTIAEYFSSSGEAAFRTQEALALAGIVARSGPFVLATGGGAVLRPENCAALRAGGGLIVYLAAPLNAIQERLRRHAGGRPSLSGANVADEAERMLAQRDPLYRAVANRIVIPDDLPHHTAARIAAEFEASLVPLRPACDGNHLHADDVVRPPQP